MAISSARAQLAAVTGESILFGKSPLHVTIGALTELNRAGINIVLLPITLWLVL